MQEFHAIYENGVLRPLVPLGFPESTEVVATVRPADENGKTTGRRSTIGLMSDCSDLLDEIVEEAMQDRENRRWRIDQ